MGNVRYLFFSCDYVKLHDMQQQRINIIVIQSNPESFESFWESEL